MQPGSLPTNDLTCWTEPRRTSPYIEQWAAPTWCATICQHLGGVPGWLTRTFSEPETTLWRGVLADVYLG
jgi:hypothetical protein